jgi:hypothetical protein
MVDSSGPVIELPSASGPPPKLLSFDYTMVAIFFITLVVLAGVFVGGLTLMDTKGNAVGSRQATEALTSKEGKLVFAPVPARTLMGNILRSQEESTPAPIGPFPRHSIWMIDESGLPGALPPSTGNGGDVLTYLNGKAVWEPPRFPHPQLLSSSSRFNASRGLFGGDTVTAIQMFTANSDIQEALPFPVWNGRFVFSLVKPNPTKLLEGVLIFSTVGLLPENDRYELRADPGVGFPVSIDASVTIFGATDITRPSLNFFPQVLCYITAPPTRTIRLELVVTHSANATVPDNFIIHGEIRICAPLQLQGAS